MLALGDEHRRSQFAHDFGGGADLADTFLLHAQTGQDRRQHRVGDFAAHDLAHQRDHLVVEDLAMLDRALQGLLWRYRHVGFVPIASVGAPSGAMLFIESINNRASRLKALLQL